MNIPSKESVDFLMTVLRRSPDGATYGQLRTKLEPLIDVYALNVALQSQVNAGHVRYGFGVHSNLDQYGQLVYYASSDFGLVPVSRDQVDSVLSFLNTCHATQSLGGNGSINVVTVYEAFHQLLPRDGIGYALNALREDKLVEFQSRGDTAWLTLAPQQQFTVIAQDIRTSVLRWFHVRAGTEQCAMDKVMTSPNDAVLELMGVAPGWVTIRPIGANPGILFERV